VADEGRRRISRELVFAAFAGPSSQTDDPRVLEHLTRSIETESVRAGHVVFREGERSEHVHFMGEGRMRLSCPGRKDWVYRGRWVVGTSDLLLARPRARTAVMETDAQLFRLPGELWFEVMERRPEVLLDALIGFARGLAGLHARAAPDGAFPTIPPAGPMDASSLAGRARLLASLPLFRGTPMQVVLELAEIAERTVLAADQTVLVEGRPSGRVFVVTRGSIEVSRVEPQVRAIFSAGSIVGGALSLGDAEAVWRARAIEPAEVLWFWTEDLLDHLEENFEATRAIMAALSLERDRICDVLAERLGELVLD
jgi:CRP-like cAMP-binding protein